MVSYLAVSCSMVSSYVVSSLVVSYLAVSCPVLASPSSALLWLAVMLLIFLWFAVFA